MLEETPGVTTSKQSDTKRTLKIETEKSANGSLQRRPKFTSDPDVSDDNEAKRAMDRVGVAPWCLLAVCAGLRQR